MREFRLILGLFFICSTVFGQNLLDGNVSGSFQSDFQFYQDDSEISAVQPEEKVGSNSFLNLNYSSTKINFGVRFENYAPVLQGYDARYEGSGVPYRYFQFNDEDLSITVGNIYEQFGTGLVLRSYNDWGLGVDNSIDGVSIRYKIHDAIEVKGLIGKQRFYFDQGAGRVRGGDIEVSLNELLDSLLGHNTNYSIGGSVVSRYQEDKDPIYNLPENVATFSGRVSISNPNFQFKTEYAYKVNDPSFSNNTSYKEGQAIFLNAAYFKKGFSVGLNLKRLDNFDFRSDRTATGNDLLINYLPPLTINYTYRLFSLYPYVTQPNGEMGGQFDLQYKLKKGSALGGKYGTQLALNYTLIHDIEREEVDDDRLFTSSFFEVGEEQFYNALSLEVSRKMNKKLKLAFTYQYFEANNKVLLLSDAQGTIQGNIGVVETNFKINKRKAIKVEIQGLFTGDDNGNWYTTLVEYYANRHFFISVLDDYNSGSLEIHYLSGNIGYKKGSLRTTLGYGRQREGVLCIGGVCRVVPPTNGLSFSISKSF